MYNFLGIIKNVFVVLYILAISYLILINDSFSLLYNFNQNIIPIIFFVSIVFFLYHYIKRYINSKNIEKEFSLIVNHNFRTPLTKVLWFSRELEKEITINEKLLLAKNIENTSKKILDIVDLFFGVNDANNKSGYFLKAQSIRSIIENVISKYREEINKKNLNFKMNNLDKMPDITIDLKKISFVFDSIIENAILYTEKGGNIEINAFLDKNDLILSIMDNGIGINIFERMKIFGKFYRSKRAILANPDGMGLKLYLSKKIVKRHKGKISFKSSGKNKGCTFFIKLPLK